MKTKHQSRALRILGSTAALALGLTQTTGAFAQTYSQQCPVAGTYSLNGTLPGSGGAYRGEAMITSRDSGCYMKWYPPNDSDGTGFFVNEELTIYFTFANGVRGVVKYRRDTNGSMRGTWWTLNDPNVKGTEYLIPMALAPR